jgi:hypothetical protein
MELGFTIPAFGSLVVTKLWNVVSSYIFIFIEQQLLQGRGM